MQRWFNPFVPNAPFLYFLRFQGVEKGDIGNKWVKPILHKGSIADVWQGPKCSSLIHFTTQKMKLFLRDFFSKCDQICSFRRIWSHLRKKSLMENFIFCVVLVTALLLVLYLVKQKKDITSNGRLLCNFFRLFKFSLLLAFQNIVLRKRYFLFLCNQFQDS